MSALLLVAVFSVRPATVQRARDSSFRSDALRGALHFEAYLPTDYSTSGRRYPVVYFLHGLPAGDGDYRGLGFVEQALDSLSSKAILIVPQGARGRRLGSRVPRRGGRAQVGHRDRT